MQNTAFHSVFLSAGLQNQSSALSLRQRKPDHKPGSVFLEWAMGNHNKSFAVFPSLEARLIRL